MKQLNRHEYNKVNWELQWTNRDNEFSAMINEPYFRRDFIDRIVPIDDVSEIRIYFYDKRFFPFIPDFDDSIAYLMGHKSMKCVKIRSMEQVERFLQLYCKQVSCTCCGR